ncbi:MAG: SCO family protein [Acetobacteraceae bacterium]|nr:SCO family protein [Acetobacteraceae bacterium]
MTTGADRGPSNRVLYAIIGLLVAGLLLGTGAYLFLSGARPVSLTVGGPFSLIDGDGKPVTDKTWRGKYMLVYFGYTFCPDVCPATLSNVADALDKLGPKADQLQPLFITVDPKRDTPPVVKQYAAAFGPRMIGLTGSPEQIGAAARAYRVYYTEHRTGTGPEDYTMDHSSVLYLMGPDGRFVGPVRADQAGPEIAAALAKLMS